MPLVSLSEISSLKLASVAAQAGLSLHWSQTPKIGFLVTWLTYIQDNIPYKNKLLEALQCLHPGMSIRTGQIVEIASLLPCCGEYEVSLLSRIESTCIKGNGHTESLGK